MKSLLTSKAYRLFERPYELNIIGLRSQNTVSGKFDDQIHVFYKAGALKWNYHIFKATTDPGTYWLKHPLQVDGTAILYNGQYKDAYAIGLHKGKYKALVQVRPVSVIRDYDRNAILDFNNGVKKTGMYGINIHRALSIGATTNVDKWSAGCQVFENITDFNAFMELCEKHRQLYGNKFTYTLIDFRALNRATLRGIGYLAGGLLLIGSITYYYYETSTD